ncbi:hypothetical protein PACTADRAFT_38764 [Pachysolen tannophilus NRRL Y-2460]|uniref:Squalene monooxygenase n=1 Tax=Pachysolen tannophilus NRRL Y-2460 TaxID=669874 RepID=A0A1E4TYR7_PACTA|nr:hypothetical protein PACTADRAFT_38764 [Pachysolen tannophilus NRRL Y-2460]
MTSDPPSYDVIVIGAGVVGPCIATQLARQGKKVLIVERDWSEPNRIVGELMQPSGLMALKNLGMLSVINDIEAIPVFGYYIGFFNQNLKLKYPFKNDAIGSYDDNVETVSLVQQLHDDSTIKVSSWEEDERVRGVAFRHGKFISNLRQFVKNEPNVEWLEATVKEIVKNTDLSSEEHGKVIGIKLSNGDFKQGKLVISTDGIYSNFRKELTSKVPSVESYFISLCLHDCVLPAKNHGHVLLGDHYPILVYQISPSETRILCAYKSNKLPSQKTVIEYLNKKILPNLPDSVKPSFKFAIDNLDKENYKIMPNQYLTAEKNVIPGLLIIGDALNMRHPLTGGGMTVGLNDVVLVSKLLSQVDNFEDTSAVLEQLLAFHDERKNLDSVINVLSIALFQLFSAENKYLSILQRGCFAYFQLGNNCVAGPIGLLSGTIPKPLVLFQHFFSVAFYAIYLNFLKRGILGFPLAIVEAIGTLYTAIVVFTPYLYAEMLG